MTIKIDPSRLTGTLKSLAEKAAKKEGDPEYIDTEKEVTIFKNTAQRFLDFGIAKDFTQDDVNKILGLEKSQKIKPAVQSSEKSKKLGEDVILKIAIDGYFNFQKDKFSVKAIGNNVYEVKYKDLDNINRNDIITINPDDNSFIIKYSDEDNVILYKKFDENKRPLKEVESQSGEVVIEYQWEYDNNGNLVKEIRDDVFGYKCIEYIYNENNELTSRVVKDREGNQINK